MVEKQIPRDIERSFECSICFEDYSATRMPSTLPCGHSICIHCILHLVKNSSISCPMDKKLMKLEIISGNNSLMNLIGAVKSFYGGKNWTPINSVHLKFTKPCKFYSSNRNCQYGDKCRYLHVEKNPVPVSDSYSSSYLSDDSRSSYFMDSYDDSEFYDDDDIPDSPDTFYDFVEW
jgi:Ring finger domain/Zinc finger C-x8-C-x5-C-x3-H type (and similar)